MAITVIHAFVNPQADSGNTNITQPSNWNADHSFSGTTTGGILYANSSSKLEQDASNLFWDSTNHRLGIQNNAPGSLLTIGAGNTTIAPIRFTSNTSLLATPTAGTMEYDGTVFYSNFAASQRGVNMTEQFIMLSSAYTLTSTTSQQKIFNAPASGTITVLGTTTYIFECLLSISAMSATSGNFLFDVKGAGTATITTVAYWVFGTDATTQTTPAAISGSFWSVTPSTGNNVTAATGTAAMALIKGVVRVNGAGTLIPSIGLVTGATAVVANNSYFSIRPVGTNTVQSVGNWS